DGGAFGLHGHCGVGVVRGVEERVPEGEHPPDVCFGLEDAGHDDWFVDAEGCGLPVGGDGVEVPESPHAGARLSGPFQVGGLDRLGGGDQVGDLVFGAAGGAPVADVLLGGLLDAVFDAADTGDVLAGGVGKGLAG